MTIPLSAARLFRDGTPVLVGDEDDDTTFIAAAAGTIESEQLARLQTLGHGTVVLGMSQPVAERLQLPSPAPSAHRRAELRLMAPVDAALGTDGGWSLHDRALTMRVAADPSSGPSSLTSPGHVLAGQISAGARGAAAAALELALLAGLEPVVALSPALDDAGGVTSFAALMADPRLQWLPHASSAELHSLAAWRSARDLAVTCELPTRAGQFRAVACDELGYDGGENERVTIAFVHGEPSAAPDPFVHVHVACRLGDVFGSLLCDCRAELDAAIRQIVAAGSGVIVYTQPTGPSLMDCPRDRRFERPSVDGLLRAIGVDTGQPRRSVPDTAQGPGHGKLEACA